MPLENDALVSLAQTKVIANIGQIDASAKRALDKAVKAGRIETWRGYWAPVTGAQWGWGPLKRCWGPIGSKRALGVAETVA